MKRIIFVLGLVAAFALLAGTAHADRYMNPTCGQTNGASKGAVAVYLHHSGPPSTWVIQWGDNCGTGATVSTEIQKSTSPGTWVDMAGSSAIFTCVGSCSDEVRTHTYTGLEGCNTSTNYRLHVWANANAGTFPDSTVLLNGGC